MYENIFFTHNTFRIKIKLKGVFKMGIATMTTNKYQTCIDKCNRCAQECRTCADECRRMASM